MHRLNQLHNKTTTVPESDLPFNPRNRLLQEADLRAILDGHGLVGIQFRNINLYRNALVHRSYCTMKNADFESGNGRRPEGTLPLQDMSYERLEFLGDAILGMIVARYLYERYPDQNEGFLSRIRTKIVNGKALGFLAEKVGLTPFIIISKQVEEMQGRKNYKIAEDVFEAFIAAIYMDFQTESDAVALPKGLDIEDGPLSGAGFYIAEKWVVSVIERYFDFAELIQSRSNYKDMLSRYMMHTFQDAPRFFEVSVDIRNNAKVFTYCVKDKAGAVLGRATGATKKDAENSAARAALIYYGKDPDS